MSLHWHLSPPKRGTRNQIVVDFQNARVFVTSAVRNVHLPPKKATRQDRVVKMEDCVRLGRNKGFYSLSSIYRRVRNVSTIRNRDFVWSVVEKLCLTAEGKAIPSQNSTLRITKDKGWMKPKRSLQNRVRKLNKELAAARC